MTLSLTGIADRRAERVVLSARRISRINHAETSNRPAHGLRACVARAGFRERRISVRPTWRRTLQHTTPRFLLISTF